MADLLAAAFSSVFQSTVVTYDEYCREKNKKGWQSDTKLDIGRLFHLRYVSGPFGDRDKTLFGPTIPPCVNTLTLYVKTLADITYIIHVPANATVIQLKEAIAMNKDRIPTDQQTLIFAGKQLEDHRTLGYYGIVQESTLYLALRLLGGGSPLYTLDESLLDRGFDYDFTGTRDDGTKFTRGGYPYYRPYGWRRYALKVLGRYENDTWLGTGRFRVDSSPGEWPVSYHGTGIGRTGNIAQEGYDLSKGKRFRYGRGVYSTPSIEVAARYATRFLHKGKNYRVVFQNRVSPDDLKTVNSHATGVGEYWIQPNQDAVRPYGICVQEY